MTEPTKSVQWRRSSDCTSGTCVEVADAEDRVLVRDSKDPAAAPLTFTREEWAAFVAGVKRGEFD
jgi:hypothetical protein